MKEKDVKYSWIYKLSSVDGYIYIGQTTNINKRFIKYKNPNCHEQGRIYEKIKQIGWNNFFVEILYEGFCSKEFRHELEKHFIRIYNTFDSKKGLNTQSGGSNRYKISKEGRKNLSISHVGQKQSKETCKKRWETIRERHERYRDIKPKCLKKEFEKDNKNIVLDITTGVYYYSATEAAKSLGIKRTTLTEKLRGKNRNNTNLIYV